MVSLSVSTVSEKAAYVKFYLTIVNLYSFIAPPPQSLDPNPSKTPEQKLPKLENSLFDYSLTMR